MGRNGEMERFLEEAGPFISDLRSWSEGDWEEYQNFLRMLFVSALDVGSMDDVVSDIHRSLVFHIDASVSQQHMFTKAEGRDVRIETIQGFPDEEGATRAETEVAPTIAQQEQSDCSDIDLDRNGNQLIVTMVCPADVIDLRYANYFLSTR